MKNRKWSQDADKFYKFHEILPLWKKTTNNNNIGGPTLEHHWEQMKSSLPEFIKMVLVTISQTHPQTQDSVFKEKGFITHAETVKSR